MNTFIPNIFVKPILKKPIKKNNSNDLELYTVSALKKKCVEYGLSQSGLKQDIIFIDPPWDGIFYKAYDKLHLYLGKMDIIDIIKEWYEKKLAKLYIIKCPANLDFDPFISEFKKIFIEKLKNYNVIYIIHV